MEKSASSFVKTLAFGTIAWLTISMVSVVWFFMQPGEKGLAAIGVPLFALTAGHIPGGGILLLYGLVQIIRRQIDFRGLIWATIVYFFPFLIMLGLSGLLLKLAPTYVAQNDFSTGLISVSGPLIAILYIVGLINGYSHRNEPIPEIIIKTIAPQMIGVIGILVWTLISVLGSPDFQSRSVFNFSINKTSLTNEGVILECELTLKKDLDYEYKALYVEHGGIGQIVRGEIRWLHINGKPKTTGNYQIQIVFKNLKPSLEKVDRRELFFDVYAKSKDIIDPIMPYTDLIRTFKIPIRFLPVQQ